MQKKIILAERTIESFTVSAVADEPNEIGQSFESLMTQIVAVNPPDFIIGFSLPEEVGPLIGAYSRKYDIGYDIVLRSVVLAWTIDHETSQDALYPIHKFVLQQLLKNINQSETALISHLSAKIGNSRFSETLELQDMEGSMICGKNVLYHPSPKKKPSTGP
ncbi:MAG: hypothetical protein WC838_03115 [Candidatus Margulisiibacteriota bacterium]|jgi:hypothetical protein